MRENSRDDGWQAVGPYQSRSTWAGELPTDQAEKARVLGQMSSPKHTRLANRVLGQVGPPGVGDPRLASTRQELAIDI